MKLYFRLFVWTVIGVVLVVLPATAQRRLRPLRGEAPRSATRASQSVTLP